MKSKQEMVRIQALVTKPFRDEANVAAIKLGVNISTYLRECLEKLIKKAEWDFPVRTKKK